MNYHLNNDIFKKYPELDTIVNKIRRDTTQAINRAVKNVKSNMRYKAQYVLEELIKQLQELV